MEQGECTRGAGTGKRTPTEAWTHMSHLAKSIVILLTTSVYGRSPRVSGSMPSDHSDLISSLKPPLLSPFDR